MKRFALFEFDTYYPGGGWCDYVDSFETVEEAVAYYKLPRPRDGRKTWDSTSDHFQIVDLETGSVVEEDR